MPTSKFSLTATDSAKEKIQNLNMDINDAIAVITQAESNNNFVISPTSNHRFAHLQLDPITLWVEYRQVNTNSFVLESIWAHRIKIIENYD